MFFKTHKDLENSFKSLIFVLLYFKRISLTKNLIQVFLVITFTTKLNLDLQVIL